jgi:hypothetical protein
MPAGPASNSKGDQVSKRTSRVVLATALCALLAAPAGASAFSTTAVNPVPGGVYKGKLENQPDHVRIKVGDSGRHGRFTLRCAGVVRDPFSIQNGRFSVADPGFRARGRFPSRIRARGEVLELRESVSNCQKDLFKARLR